MQCSVDRCLRKETPCVNSVLSHNEFLFEVDLGHRDSWRVHGEHPEVSLSGRDLHLVRVLVWRALGPHAWCSLFPCQPSVNRETCFQMLQHPLELMRKDFQGPYVLQPDNATTHKGCAAAPATNCTLDDMAGEQSRLITSRTSMGAHRRTPAWQIAPP
jgi:hypothetical protein